MIPSSHFITRPIALTGCIMKLFEKMVNTRIVWFYYGLSSIAVGHHLSSLCDERTCCESSSTSKRLTTQYGGMVSFVFSTHLGLEAIFSVNPILYHRPHLQGQGGYSPLPSLFTKKVSRRPVSSASPYLVWPSMT